MRLFKRIKKDKRRALREPKVYMREAESKDFKFPAFVKLTDWSSK